MKTNEFLEKYIDSEVTANKAKESLSELGWKDGVFERLTVKPSHFNYFSFEVRISRGDRPTTLTVEAARSLAIYLLKATEGLEDTHKIIDEILKREGKI